MKSSLSVRAGFIFGLFLSGVILWPTGFGPSHPARVTAAQFASPVTNHELEALQAEIKQLRSIVGDQSHAMADVGYHFANLWFAAERKNWPLAKFYFDETRSHLNWAVRIIPVRKDPLGNEVRLQDIWQALDNTFMAKIGRAIETKNSGEFPSDYRQMLEGCYSCHKASGKPFLRPQIPKSPPQPIINFDPGATWPQ